MKLWRGAESIEKKSKRTRCANETTEQRERRLNKRRQTYKVEQTKEIK